MYSASHSTERKILLQILLFGSVWILLPIMFNEFYVENFNVHKAMRHLIGVAIIVAINLKWLLPKFYFKNKYWQYFFMCVLVIVVITLLQKLMMENILAARHPLVLDRMGPPNPRFPRELNAVGPMILTFMASSLIEISSFANQKMKEAMALQNEKLETEMKLLKSQFNPHFLFNALNNIYSISLLTPEKTSDNLLKLSGLLRYNLYECNADKMSLSKEIEYLKNFVDLKLLKDSRGLNVELNIDSQNPKLIIAPTLLIPFVENAFKHSNIEDLENGWITINLKSEGNRIRFTVENSLNKKNFTKDEVGGIGLTNVKRQLVLIYPKKHQLLINTTNDKFTVELEINLV